MFQLHDIGLTASGQRYEITDTFADGDVEVTLLDSDEGQYVVTERGTFAEDENYSLTPATHTRLWLALFGDLHAGFFFEKDHAHEDAKENDTVVVVLTESIVPREMVGLPVIGFGEQGDDE